MDEGAMLAEAGTAKKKIGTGAKVAIGCGSGCLVLVLITVVTIVAGVLYVKKIITRYEKELKGYGFETVMKGQVIEITDPVDEPVLLKAQSVRIMADCSTNIAVLAQMCELHGTVKGRLYFRGQLLTIHPGAEILGGLDVQAQLVQNNGKIEGGVTGEYQLYEPGAAATNSE